jgi:hypothetical protein
MVRAEVNNSTSSPDAPNHVWAFTPFTPLEYALLLMVVVFFIAGVLIGYTAGLYAGQQKPFDEPIAEPIAEPTAALQPVKLVHPMDDLLMVSPKAKSQSFLTVGESQLVDLNTDSIMTLTKKQALQALCDLKREELIPSGMPQHDLEYTVIAHRIELDSYTVHGLRRLLASILASKRK